MNYLLIGIDGVLADLEGDIVTRLKREFGHHGEANRENPVVLDRFPKRKDIFDRAMEYLQNEDVYRCLNRDMGAVNFVSNAYERGYKIAFLCKRDRTLEDITERWLKKAIMWMVSPEIIWASEEDDLKEIIPHVKIFVDDNPYTVRSFEKLGGNAYSWDQPWNYSVYPKIWTDSRGEAVLQTGDEADGVYFWNYIEEIVK